MLNAYNNKTDIIFASIQTKFHDYRDVAATGNNFATV